MTIELEIINPISGKGFEEAKEYLARPEVVDELNYIELGLIVRVDRTEVKDKSVEIKATDATQNKSFTGTGNLATIYLDGLKKIVSYYPFRYEFKTEGEHVIDFLCEEITEKLTLNVSLDVRPTMVCPNCKQIILLSN